MSLKEKLQKLIGFPVTVIIFQKRGNTCLIHVDKAKRIEVEDGSFKYFLKGLGKDIKPPDLDSIYVDSRGKQFLFLSTVDMIQFVATKLNFKTEKGVVMQSVDKDMINWLVATYKKGYEKYSKQSFWQQYGGLLTMFGLVIGFAIMVNVTIGYLEAVGSALGSASQGIITASENLATCQAVRPIP